MFKKLKGLSSLEPDNEEVLTPQAESYTAQAYDQYVIDNGLEHKRNF